MITEVEIQGCWVHIHHMDFISNGKIKDHRTVSL